MNLSQEELDLINDIRDLGYGDIYDVSIPVSAKIVHLELMQNEKNLIYHIRDGNQFIDEIKVVNHLPVFLIQKEVLNRTGCKCKKLKKLS